MSVKREIITCKDIIEAYEKHGDDFIVIDADKKRDWKNYTNYLDVHIKKADSEIIMPICLKMDVLGVEVSTNIREPNVRQYEQVRFALRQYNEEGKETVTMKALNILCTSYKNVFKKMVSDNVFTHHKDVPRKKNQDGVLRPVLLISTDPKTPMQNTIVNRLTQEVEEIDNPIFWIDLPNKRYGKNAAPTPEQFGTMCYKENDGSDGKPFMKFQFDTTFRNFNPITGEKTPVGDMDEDGNVIIDNTNIHKFIAKNAVLLGSFKFEIKVSSRGAKLNISLYGDTSIIPPKTSNTKQIHTDDELKEFAKAYLDKCKITDVKEDTIEDENEDEEEDLDEEYDT